MKSARPWKLQAPTRKVRMVVIQDLHFQAATWYSRPPALASLCTMLLLPEPSFIILILLRTIHVDVELISGTGLAVAEAAQQKSHTLEHRKGSLEVINKQ